MKRRTSSVITGALLVGAMVVALAPAAWAPRAWGLPNLNAPCGVNKTFMGSLYINDFDSKEGLLALGTIDGACTQPGVDPAAVSNTFNVEATIADASCDSISVLLADIDGGHGITIDMSDDPVVLDNPTQDKALRKQMCQVAGRSHYYGSVRQLQRLVADMDRILLALAGITE